VPPAGARCFLNGPIVHGTANKLERRSVLQFTGGIAAGFSYLAGPENVNRHLSMREKNRVAPQVVQGLGHRKVLFA
jgi:hypothetical protein